MLIRNKNQNSIVTERIFFKFFFITFSYPCNGRESIDFGSNFRTGDFDGFTRFEVP